MPNGHDKNWVRVCLAIDGFRARHGHWPTRVRIMPASFRDLVSNVLTPSGFALVNSSVRLLPEPDAAMIAEDSNGREFCYGSDQAEILPDHEVSAIEHFGDAIIRHEGDSSDATFSVPICPVPAARCYWVVDQVFLAGAYPGSPDPDDHRNRLESLWEAGVRTFINLVQEQETNSQGIPFTRYEDIVRDMARKEAARSHHLRLPIVDLDVPSTDRMNSILDAIDLSVGSGKPVYLHCFGGVGRTGTVVSCWLIRHGHATKQDVNQILNRLRVADKVAGHRQAPETESQRQFVQAWEPFPVA